MLGKVDNFGLSFVCMIGLLKFLVIWFVFVLIFGVIGVVLMVVVLKVFVEVINFVYKGFIFI